MVSILAASTGTIVGLMVGVEFAVALIMNRLLLGLPSEAALFTSRARAAKRMGQVMPLWYIGSLLLIVVLAVTTWGTTTSAGALASIFHGAAERQRRASRPMSVADCGMRV